MIKFLKFFIFNATTLFLFTSHADFMHEIKLSTKLELNRDLEFSNKNNNEWSIYFQEGEQVPKLDLDTQKPFCRAYLFLAITDEDANIKDALEESSGLDITLPKGSLVTLTWINFGDKTNPVSIYDQGTELKGSYLLPGQESGEYQEFSLNCQSGESTSELLKASDLLTITGQAFSANILSEEKATVNILDPLDLPYGCLDTTTGCIGVSKDNKPAFKFKGIKNIKALSYENRDEFFNKTAYGWSLQNNLVKSEYYYEYDYCRISQSFINSFSLDYNDNPQPVNFPLDGSKNLLPPANFNFPEDYDYSEIHSAYFLLEKSVFEEEVSMSSSSSITFNLPPSRNTGEDFYPLQILCGSSDFKVMTYRDVLTHISDYFSFEFTED